MEAVARVIKGIHTCYNRYTRGEIRRAWYSGGQGHERAVEGGIYCARIPCLDASDALVLSALFVRQVFSIPSCAHWNGTILHLYCGDAGSGAGVCLSNALQMSLDYFHDRMGYVAKIEKESGPLFIGSRWDV